MYGQMTAGSYCYIGPQGIVHGTTITVMNAGRKYLQTGDLNGKVFVTSGLGGMSGAQAKAAVIAGCIGVIAEVSPEALKKRHEQGWLMEWTDDLDKCMQRIRQAKEQKAALSLGYLGNVVDLWERFAKEVDKTGDLLVELGSDQTSCHNPFNGGYYPVQLTFDEANHMMADRPEKFRELVEESLRRQLAAIDRLAQAGMRFWDYGNAFLLECRRAGADVDLPGEDNNATRFKYPSYVQDIMGDVFSLGFGPFRWVCTSGDEKDLALTDSIAKTTLERLARSAATDQVAQQYADNIRWITEAPKHQLVVGSQARILYCDERGRMEVSLEFNKAVADGRLRGPVVISRDHHDVSGTDSPFRETSNIDDGSAFTADMAVQNFVGDSFRGATWVSLHNGGGVGWGEVINGGFGLVLDGSEEAASRAQKMLSWDVCNGVARRCWAGNRLAREAIEDSMNRNPLLKVFLPNQVQDTKLLDKIFK